MHMHKKIYQEPVVRVKDLDMEVRFLGSLEGPGGGDLDIEPLDPGIWG